jgi:NACHT domain/Sulfatase-modifying factor enzyme 1
MRHKVLLAHAEGEESVAEQLAGPLRDAGYDVSHAGTVLIGDSVVEEASRLLLEGAPLVLCGTVKALGTGWAHRLVNAARKYPGVHVFPIQIERDAYIQVLSFEDKVGLYWQDPNRTIAELVAALRKHFPAEITYAPDAAKAKEQLLDFLQSQITFYEKQEWTRRAVAIKVTDTNGIKYDADAALLTWFTEATTRLLIVSGDFGSGKTWLARRFCRNLSAKCLQSEDYSAIPVFIPLYKLHGRHIASFAELLSFASPSPLDPAASLQSARSLLIVLDGLDELLVPSDISDSKSLLNEMSNLIPYDSRIAITCRSQVLEGIQGWVCLLFEDIRGGGLEDRTRIAIDFALGRGAATSRILNICDVESEQAEAYMHRSPAARLWQNVANQQSFRELATMPFILFLLEEALPRLQSEGQAPNLPGLYEAAINTWLYRDSRLSSIGTELLWRRLEDLAESTFTGRRTGDRRPFIGLNAGDRRHDDLLLRTGIVERVKDGQFVFKHFSIFEYLIARVLLRQITGYSAALLSRINLVYMYNINRFLIPSLFKSASETTSTMRELFIKDSATRGGCCSAEVFTRFVRDTHWRKHEGYGSWTIKKAQDGTSPYLGEDQDLQASLELDTSSWRTVPLLGNPEFPVTGISWYDAFQCCRWAGGRLPTAEELASGPSADSDTPIYEWSSSWMDERTSRIAVVRTSGQPRGSKQGVNPDMRSSLIGFRIVQ